MLEKLAGLMMDHFGEHTFVEHTLKVYAYATLIGSGEGISEDEADILGAAALLHDVGIPPALKKYGSAEGPYQEHEGEKLVSGFLEQVGGAFLTPLVGWLVGHHHSHSFAPEDKLLQILMEADYLVNLAEGSLPELDPARLAREFFRTPTGTRYLKALFKL